MLIRSSYGKLVLTLLTFFFITGLFSQEKKPAVDYKSDFTRLIKMGDSTVVQLIGNVFFYHNGAIIACDSAYRYSERNMEGTGNVIINQKSTYIYGDRVTYNGETNIARVFSPLIKLVDSSATMYTYNLSYNTKTQIAEFYGGATLSEGSSNIMESERGLYHSNTQLMEFIDSVVATNKEYLLKNAKLDFNMAEDRVLFDTCTYIWKSDGEYLQADRGEYDKPNGVYNFTKNAYILTKEQEGWSDSLRYLSNINEVEMRSNIQLSDTTQQTLGFGDYGYYWNLSNHSLLTKTPSIIMYNRDNTADSVFISGDTIRTRPVLDRLQKNSPVLLSDSTLHEIGAIDSLTLDSLSNLPKDSIAIDSTIVDTISVDVDSVATVIPTDSAEMRPADIKAAEKEEKEEIARTVKEAKAAIKEEKKALKKEKREEKKFARQERYLQWLEKQGIPVDIDTIKLEEPADTVKKKEIKEETPPEIKNVADSSDIIIRAYANGKIFRFDMQSICDTMILETVDSTFTSIGKPVVWNELNQITGERIKTYIKNGALYRSRLFGYPIIAQKIGLSEYNQIQGETMDALYRDNALYRLNINGSAKTLFYREEPEEGGPPDGKEIVAFTDSKSENMVIWLDSTTITRIKWIGKTNTVTYPMGAIPASEPRMLEGFKWREGEKPSKGDVFNRVIRPSYRSQAERITKPKFVITEQINNYRNELINSKMWRDRNEPIGIDPSEFKTNQP